MSVVIGNNIGSLQAQRRLAESTAAVAKASERLSTGLRINRASDDAAGLQIADGLRVDARVLSQATRNVNDGISALNIAQGAVESLTGIVTRQIELAEQAANGTYGYKQRVAMNREANELVNEFNRIVGSTRFNGINSVDGSSASLQLQAGYGTNGGIAFGIGTQLGFAAGNGTFGSTVTTTPDGIYDAAPGVISASTAADLNNDGIPDLLCYNGSSGDLLVMIGNGDGTFLSSTSYAASASGSSWSALDVGDFNGDGIADVLTSSFRSISIRLGNGDGTLRARTTYYNASLTTSSASLQIGDLNGDGVADVIRTNSTTGFVAAFIGNGDGSFHVSSSYVTDGANTYGAEIYDVNGDGRSDIISLSGSTNKVSVLFGNGNGTFLASVSYASVGSVLYGLKLADFNRDGILDLVTAGNGLGVLLGNSDGSFRAAVSYAAGTGAINVFAEDVNGDGVIDIVSQDQGSVTLNTLLGNGDGTFQARISKGTELYWDAELADLNGDGILDSFGVRTTTDALGVDLGRADTVTPRRNNRQSSVDLTNVFGARQAMIKLRNQLTRANAELGNIGSVQSRLAAAAGNLQVSGLNLRSADSQLRDAEITEESAQYVRTQILQKAASAVLAQANQQPALVLKLLKT